MGWAVHLQRLQLSYPQHSPYVSPVFLFFLCLRAGLEVLGYDCVMGTARLLQWLLYVAAMSKHILNQLNEVYVSTSRSLSLKSGCKWSLDVRRWWLRCEVMHFLYFFFKEIVFPVWLYNTILSVTFCCCSKIKLSRASTEHFFPSFMGSVTTMAPSNGLIL